ncbi:MAG: DUF3536 domain-containing protein [Actinobacteria bacterium]|nr:DUF3536 domain-containing protein [Actinomycetota bacterium]
MNIKRHICIHGHFYQPSRANPWLETIEIQEDAYPYHDWNEKINAQCYSANSGSHILDGHKKIKKVFNNYSRMSFNFGPVLLSWIKAHDMDTYRAIIDADKAACERFGGHGTAIAQVYNHIIMPLASKKDKYIQTHWAVKDFEANFKRKPEGIWLSEAAVDSQTLEIISDFGIKFTILSPNQAAGIKRISGQDTDGWTDVSDGSIDTRMPYLCRLENGNSIIIFFYDDEISTKMSFGNLLEDGEFFVKTLKEAPLSRLMHAGFNTDKDSQPAFKKSTQENIYPPEIVCAASDGETFGHHHRFGDMALAYALDTFENAYPGTLTVFGQYIEKYSPLFEVSIKQNSSWSCSHGVCRWEDDCGCSTGSGHEKGWNQKWRKPLRKAVDDLAKQAGAVYEQEIRKYINPSIKDAWEPVYEYIDVINDRSEKNVSSFLNKYTREGPGSINGSSQLITGVKQRFAGKSNSGKQPVNLLKLLEMYRHAMLMQSSDGWFFDEISGIESIQIMRHACRAIELAEDLSSQELEPGFIKTLKNAKSNISSYIDGKNIYEKYVAPSLYDFKKILAYLAFEMLFKENPRDIFSCRIKNLKTEKIKINHGEVIAARAAIFSALTLEGTQAEIAAYNFKNKDVLSPASASSFVKINKEIKIGNLLKSTVLPLNLSIKKIASDNTMDTDTKKEKLEKLLQSYFKGSRYTVKDFLKDSQLLLAEQALLNETASIKPVILNLFNNYSKIIADLSEKKLQKYFLDGIFPEVEEFSGEVLLYYRLKEKGMTKSNLDEIKNIILKTETVDFISRESFNMLAAKKLEEITGLVAADNKNIELLKILEGFLTAIKKAGLEPDLWKTINRIIGIRDRVLNKTGKIEKSHDRQWNSKFKELLEILNIALP